MLFVTRVCGFEEEEYQTSYLVFHGKQQLLTATEDLWYFRLGLLLAEPTSHVDVHRLSLSVGGVWVFCHVSKLMDQYM